jgi:integrase/recombinase XerD
MVLEMRLKEIIPLYLKYLVTLGRSPGTIKNIRHGLNHFSRFLEKEGLYHIEDLTKEILSDYQQDLAFYVTAKGKLMEIESQTKLLSAVRGFTKYLKQQDYLVSDPGETLTLPKLPKRLPRVILSTQEMQRLLNAPNTRTKAGYRDKIILEILYDTGIRRAEVAGITVNDLDLETGFVRIRGKGNKERVVPLSERVCRLIKNYLLFIRPSFLNNKDSGYLFVGRFNGKMDESTIWEIVKRVSRAARLKKNVTTHTLRHTCATHMLRNGAPLRHLQEMLGHESIETTQIYTRVTINDLKEIHAKYHPSETLTD